MNELIKETLDYFSNFYVKEYVVKPSLPILYFGDLKAYNNSKLKIVTVGKNPSLNEFKLNKNDEYSFVRFPKWNKNEQNLTETLNDYFKIKPLKKWFSSFEPVLNGMNASYYTGEGENIAIHTDICSPIATNPTWSKLKPKEQNELFEKGFLIWEKLIEELNPDVILVSIPTSLFESVFGKKENVLLQFEDKKNGEKRKQPYKIYFSKYEIGQKTSKVYFGKAANKPFDTISDIQKHQFGLKCLQ